MQPVLYRRLFEHIFDVKHRVKSQSFIGSSKCFLCDYLLILKSVRFGLGRYRQSHETDLEKFSESLKSAFRQVEEMFANSKLSTAKL